MASWLTRWKLAKLVAAAAILAAILGLPVDILAAEVTADQLDYSPGTTAIITGSGFAPGETVVLQVLHADGTASDRRRSRSLGRDRGRGGGFHHDLARVRGRLRGLDASAHRGGPVFGPIRRNIFHR